MEISPQNIYPIIATGNDGWAAGKPIDVSRIIMEWFDPEYGWSPFGVVRSLLVDEDCAVAIRVRYHGALVAPDQIVATIPVFSEDKTRLYEVCVYQLHPDRTRIWLMPPDIKDPQHRQLLWPKQTRRGMRAGQRAFEHEEHAEYIKIADDRKTT